MGRIVSIADMRCSRCDEETDVLVTCPTCRVAYCLECVRLPCVGDSVAAAFADVYGPEYADLATWQAEGR